MSITKISPSVVDFDDGITISTADNTDTLTLTSTDADANFGPRLKLFRNSASAADGDAIGYINFTGTNDAGTPEEVGYAAIDARIVDASDGTEDGRLEIVTLLAGVEGTSRILMDATETVFNDNSKDLDFRVESDGNANALIVNAGNNNVGIGADPLISYSGYTTLYVGGNTNFMSNTAAEASSSVNYSHNAQFDTDGSWEYIVTDEASNYYQSGGGHYFRVAASGSAGSDITWVNGPNIDVNGNLVFPSGKGIDFSATADATGTDTSELFDDYEEGYASLQIGPDGNLSANWTGTANNAKYVKIGRFCYVTFDLTTTDKGDGSGTYATITNLPFAPVSGTGGSNASGGGFIAYSQNPTTASIYANTTVPYIMTAMGGTAYLAWSSAQDNTRLIGTFMFHTA